MGNPDYDALIIGGGHNGLVCAAYLARAGLRTAVIEARDSVGGTAASEPFAGGIANVCNCDHLTFRTTPIRDELELERHGLAYVDIDPAQFNATWSRDAAWVSYHDAERTLEAIAETHPGEAKGYRRYLDDALPAARLVLAAANDPPTWRGLLGKLARARGAGALTLLRWSRTSAAAVLRRYFTADALLAPALAVGPMVWGISPETKGSGLGALTYALRHVGRLGRPIGGSGRLPEAIAASLRAAGGEVLLGRRVTEIVCDAQRARAVRLSDGTELSATRIVSACNPHDTFLRWLRNPPADAARLIGRWRSIPHAEGYESKIDAAVGEVARLRTLPAEVPDAALGASFVIAPSVEEMDRGARMMGEGLILERPALIGNTPSAADPSVAPPGGHMFSLEALFTPYRLRGGWETDAEPRRWLEHFAAMVQPGWLDSLGSWRTKTPATYEHEFHLPAGHATSFAGGPLAALVNRNPELTRYRTAVRGLYLTGAATFPGAGVWGAAGRNAALAILAEA